MRAFVLGLVLLAACGDDTSTSIDAPAGAIDAPATIDAPAVAQTCANYCTLISQHCTAANVQYALASDCMNTCSHFPLGTAADTSGNTLGCHIYHAGDPAAGDPVLHCTHAGPGGNGFCGANCEDFCTLVLAACTGPNQQYGGDMGTCMTACGNFATTPKYSSTVTSGNSFACRLYHATAASTDPGTHCAHTAVASAFCQ